MAIEKYTKGTATQLSDNLQSTEFDCHGSGCCNTTQIDDNLVKYIQQIRNHFAKPIQINSAYRCPVHNKNIGGATNSYHTKGMAADIVVLGIAPSEVAKYAESMGILGIGLYPPSDGSFVHIDTRDYKSFWYGSGEAGRSTFGSTETVEVTATTSKKFKVAISAGHGLNTEGKQCSAISDNVKKYQTYNPNLIKEWTLNNRVSQLIKIILDNEYEENVEKVEEKLELLFVYDTSGETDTALAQRVDEANDKNVDFYLSIHHNTGANNTNDGGLIIYVDNESSSTSKQWQKELYDEIVNVASEILLTLKKDDEDGTIINSIKKQGSNSLLRDDFVETGDTRMPAVLMELGFIDSAADLNFILPPYNTQNTDLYSENIPEYDTDAKSSYQAYIRHWWYAYACASACANIIAQKAGLTKKEGITTITPPPINGFTLGARNEKVRKMKILLTLFGYDCKNFDDTFDETTMARVNTFNKFYNVDKYHQLIDRQNCIGYFTWKSESMLMHALANTNTVLHADSAPSNRIAALQKILQELNYYPMNYAINGILDNNTKEAILYFQMNQSIPGIAQSNMPYGIKKNEITIDKNTFAKIVDLYKINILEKEK